MKNVLILTVILAVILPVVIVGSLAFAAPGDVIIQIIIPADKLAEFRVGFLKVCPIRGNYTERQWVTKIAHDCLYEKYRQGKKQIAREAAYAAAYVADPNVLQTQ